MTEDLLGKLEQLADYFADAKSHDHEKTLLDAVDCIKKFERALEVYDRERARFRHAHPDMTGAYFLSGGHGKTDDNLLPDFVTIVPAYGCAWEQVYEKTDRTISYEGS